MREGSGEGVSLLYAVRTSNSSFLGFRRFKETTSLLLRAGRLKRRRTRRGPADGWVLVRRRFGCTLCVPFFASQGLAKGIAYQPNISWAPGLRSQGPVPNAYLRQWPRTRNRGLCLGLMHAVVQARYYAAALTKRIAGVHPFVARWMFNL